MATILQVLHSGGRRERCDARCHQATSPTCSCCCGGFFHGRAALPGGLEAALAAFWEPLFPRLQEAEAAGKLLIEYARDQLTGAPIIHRRGRRVGRQLDLFTPRG
jgi:hypothetical protein